MSMIDKMLIISTSLLLIAKSNYSQGGFIKHIIVDRTFIADNATSVYAIDIDGDEDIDVLSTSCGDEKIAWYKNDGSGSFGEQQVITTSADCPHTVYAADLDGDGDMDVLSASLSDDKIAWYRNEGSGSFGAQQIISSSAESARSVYAADLDGDGDLDVLSASFLDGKIAWYENIINTTDVVAIPLMPDEFVLSQNYPNPFNPLTTIYYSLPKPAFVTLKIYDFLGREILTPVSEEKSRGGYSLQFDGSNFASGIYFYQIKIGKEFTDTKKMILLK